MITRRYNTNQNYYDINHPDYWIGSGWELRPNTSNLKAYDAEGNDINADRILVDINTGDPVPYDTVKQYIDNRTREYNDYLAGSKQTLHQQLPEIVLTPEGAMDEFSKRYISELYKPVGNLSDHFKNVGDQQSVESGTDREVISQQADRNVHQNFNMTSPDKYGLTNLAKVATPILGGAAVAGGAVAAAPALTSFLATPAGEAIMYGTLGGETLNLASKLGGYNDFGHLLYSTTGNRNWKNTSDLEKMLWNLPNVGYFLSGPSSQITNLTLSGLNNSALNNVTLPTNRVVDGVKSLFRYGFYPVVKRGEHDTTIYALSPKTIFSGDTPYIELYNFPEVSGLPVDFISSPGGYGKGLMDNAIKEAKRQGYKGIVSGGMLISAPKTMRTYRYFDKKLIGNYGRWSNSGMVQRNSERPKTVLVDNLKEFTQSVKENPDVITRWKSAPVYLLTGRKPDSLLERLRNTMTDYSRNMLGIDPEITKVVVNATANAARKKAINTAARASFYFPQKDAVVKTSQLWRNQEYNNFLNSINGDNYYELVQSTAQRPKVYQPNEEYFLSHTTPWAEFTEIAILPSWAKTEEQIAGNFLDPAEFVNAYNKLYEFPHKTFGDLKATGATLGETKKVYDTPVRDLGEAHLKYGNYASGPRGVVPTAGKFPNTYEQGQGLTERPLLKTLAYPEGIYDYNPIYESIFQGPQTIVTGDELNNAVLHSNYNIYERTPNGVQKTLFLGEPKTQLNHKDLIEFNIK